MLRVALFQSETRVGQVEFFELPLKSKDSYRCTPEDIVSSESIPKIADALLHGDMHGYISTCSWYRQASGA
jgi:hypothetical protein